jgi:hypothetical protein
MGHIQGKSTEHRLTGIEVVTDDSQQVFRFTRDKDGVITISQRASTEDGWSARQIIRLDKDDASTIASVLNGSDIQHVLDKIKAIPADQFSLPKPESVKGPMDGDCTPLDIERAKAQNLLEERENIKLQMNRDHFLDKHVGFTVDGCPACEKSTRPGHGDGSLPDPGPITSDDPPF